MITTKYAFGNRLLRSMSNVYFKVVLYLSVHPQLSGGGGGYFLTYCYNHHQILCNANNVKFFYMNLTGKVWSMRVIPCILSQTDNVDTCRCKI